MPFPSWSQKKRLINGQSLSLGLSLSGDSHIGWSCEAFSKRVRAAGFWESKGNQPRWLGTFHFCNKILGIGYTTASPHLPYCKNILSLEIMRHLQRKVILRENSSRSLLRCRVWCRQTLLERHPNPPTQAALSLGAEQKSQLEKQSSPPSQGSSGRSTNGLSSEYIWAPGRGGISSRLVQCSEARTEHRGRIFVTWLRQARWLRVLNTNVACLQVNHSHLTNASNAL